ncbi:MAG: ankyrin repeat domain-containing protein [Gemmatimonadetes bacterium]|nr:ankyrin repeat domain-containing protein [Gemmatimonadota bacterium]
MRTRILGRTLGALCLGALLAGGMPPDARVADAALLGVGTAPDAPVADAAMRGDVAEVRALLRQGADVNAAQGDGMTALHWAAEVGGLELTEMLLYAGANPAARTRNGAYVPLHLASRAGRAAVAAALLEAGSDPDAATSTGARPLHFATQAASVETARTLLDHGADVDARDHAHAQTPLMWAASWGHVAVVALLVERGADLDAASRAEDIAARADADDEERERRNARLDAMIAFERAAAEGRQVTPEDIGVARNFDEVQAASDTAAADEDEEEEKKKEEEPDPLGYHDLVGTQGGLTPLLHAVREGHAATAEALLDGGADIDQVSAGDRTSPLLMATINGHFDLALDLLRRGADPTRTGPATPGRRRSTPPSTSSGTPSPSIPSPRRTSRRRSTSTSWSGCSKRGRIRTSAWRRPSGTWSTTSRA